MEGLILIRFGEGCKISDNHSSGKSLLDLAIFLSIKIY